jgi:predicted phosphoribosyltransferase
VAKSAAEGQICSGACSLPPEIEMYFTDRFEAGKVLSEKLLQYRGRPDVIVLALPRGGVPVAYEVAKALDAPLDVFLVRKLGLPGHEELAMGAVADGNVVVLNEHVVESLGIPETLIESVAQRERRELQRQRQLYRDGQPPPQIKDQIVILVDDGLATGSTVRAAIAALRKQQPKRLIVAVPVGAAETCAELRAEADEVICGKVPRQFVAVGLWYQDFSQTSDDTVRALLDEAPHKQPAHAGE